MLIAALHPWLLGWLGGDLAENTGARSVLLFLLPTIPLTVATAVGRGWLVVAAVSRLDVVSLAAYRTIGTTIAIVFVIAYTVSTSLSMLVGQRLGAGDVHGARRWVNPLSVLMAAGVAVAGSGAVLVPGVWFSWLSGDGAVVQAAADQRALWLILLPAMVVGMVSAGVIRAGGDTRSTMWIGIAAQRLFAMPLAWTLAIRLEWGLRGVVIAVTSGWGAPSRPGHGAYRLRYQRVVDGAALLPGQPSPVAIGRSGSADHCDHEPT
ncbi:MAG: MATE family efflux transporter [Acidimicrobiales bacterium]